MSRSYQTGFDMAMAGQAALPWSDPAYLAGIAAGKEALAASGSKDYNDADVAFVNDMLPHHEEALKMASTESSKGQNAEMKKLAASITSAQSAEIKQMTTWLKDRGIKRSKTKEMH